MQVDRRFVRGALGAATACAWLLALGCVAEGADAPASEIASAAEGMGDAGGDDDEESEESTAGDDDSDDGMAAPSPAPSFAAVYEVLAASCGGGNSGCHVTGMAAQLTLPDADTAYEHLVSVESQKCVGKLLVVPFEPDASVLVSALQASTECVKPMPLGRDPLAADQLAMIRAWIAAGAEP